MAVDDNFLSKFSEVLRQQGEEKEAATQETIKALENELQGYALRAKGFYPSALLEKLETAATQKGCSDPRIARLWDRFYGETYNEVYRRLLMLDQLGK